MLSKIRKKKLESNIWKFYLYRIFSCLVLVGPIFVLFLQANGLSMTQVMILQSVYTAVIMLTVIPSGIIADNIGRKKVLIVNALFFISAWIAYSVSYSFIGFLIAEILIALSAGMWLSSGTAFFYDNLRELGREGSFKRLYGTVLGINFTTFAIASLVGGYIVLHGFRLPFQITVIPAVISFFILLSLTETKEYKHGEKYYILHLKEAFKFAAKHPKIRLFMVYSALIFTVGFAGYFLYQPYLIGIQIPLLYFGVFYFAINLLAAVGSKIAHKVEKILGERKIMILLLLLFIASQFGMSRGLLIIGVIFPMLWAFTGGVFEPVISDYMNKHIESDHRATVLSLHVLMIQLFQTITAPFIGYIVDFWNLKMAFSMAVLILLIDLFILLAVFYIIRRK